MKQNIMRLFVLLLALCTFLSLPLCAGAVPNEETQEYLTYLEEGDALVLTVYFDREMPDILLLGPDEIRIPVEAGRSDVNVAVYEGWALVQVVNPAAGSWYIAMDKKSNTEVSVDRMLQASNIWIQYVRVKPVSGSRYQVEFLVDREGEKFSFEYKLYLTTTDGTGSLELKSGWADTNEPKSVDVDLGQYNSYDNYIIKLEVSGNDDGAILWDEYSSDPFSFQNTNTPAVPTGLDIYAGVENRKIELKWENYKEYRFDTYYVEITTEGAEEPLYYNEFESGETMCSLYVPAEHTKVTVNFYGRDNRLLSAPLTRDILFGDQAYLEILTPAATASNQAQIKMNIPKDNQMDVTVGEVTTSFTSDGTENTVAVGLANGDNLLRAQAAVADVFYYAERHIYKDGVPPILSLYEDYDGKTFHTPQVKIVGNAAGAAKMYLNDQELSVNEYGDFEVTINLQPGENVAEFVAEDQVGNRAKRTIYLYSPETENAVVVDNTPKKLTVMQFLPLIISGAVGIALLIWVLILVRRRERLKKFSAAALICIMAALVLISGLFLLQSMQKAKELNEKVNSMYLSKLTDESLTEAVELLEAAEDAPETVTMWMWITIGMAAILLITVVVLILLRNRKKKTPPQPQKPINPTPPPVYAQPPVVPAPVTTPEPQTPPPAPVVETLPVEEIPAAEPIMDAPAAEEFAAETPVAETPAEPEPPEELY